MKVAAYQTSVRICTPVKVVGPGDTFKVTFLVFCALSVPSEVDLLRFLVLLIKSVFGFFVIPGGHETCTHYQMPTVCKDSVPK